MTPPRAQVGAGVIDGVLHAVGGYNDLTDVGWITPSRLETALGAQEIFTTVDPYEKHFLGPDRIPGGRNRARRWTSMVERYDDAADSWSFVASFPLERQYPAVAVL